MRSLVGTMFSDLSSREAGDDSVALTPRPSSADGTTSSEFVRLVLTRASVGH
jgi:hypothetical protein